MDKMNFGQVRATKRLLTQRFYLIVTRCDADQRAGQRNFETTIFVRDERDWHRDRAILSNGVLISAVDVFMHDRVFYLIAYFIFE